MKLPGLQVGDGCVFHLEIALQRVDFLLHHANLGLEQADRRLVAQVPARHSRHKHIRAVRRAVVKRAGLCLSACCVSILEAFCDDVEVTRGDALLLLSRGQS